jgi:hypothetical protein
MLEGGKWCITTNVTVDDVVTLLKREQAGSRLKKKHAVFFMPAWLAIELAYNVYTTVYQIKIDKLNSGNGHRMYGNVHPMFSAQSARKGVTQKLPTH